MTPTSWRRGCPVALADLRLLTVSHWGFDGAVKTGELIVHENAAVDVRAVMRKLFRARFPIRRMELIDAYGGSDFDSIEADNTSAFNCRRATGSGELVAARVRARDRSQSDREPLRRERPRLPRRELALRRSLEAPQRDGARRWEGRARVPLDRVGLGRLLERKRQGLPALLGQRRLRGSRVGGDERPGDRDRRAAEREEAELDRRADTEGEDRRPDPDGHRAEPSRSRERRARSPCGSR